MQQPQPAHRIGITGIPGLKLAIHPLQEPAARQNRESRDQGDGNCNREAPLQGKSKRPDDSGNGQNEEIVVEHAKDADDVRASPEVQYDF